MTSYCPYCGNAIRSADKFCILCGKPLLSDISKSSKKSKKFESESTEDVESKNEIQEEELEEIEDEKKKKDKKEKEEVVRDVQPLPDDVKRQIELHLELSDIKQKKATLADKLKDFTKLLRSPKYETDFEYGEKIEIQLKAVKTLITELKQKENEIKANVEGEFIVERLEKQIKIKKEQLRNLIREHKLKKIKDKNVVKTLKEKYKQQLESLETEQADLIIGIRAWIGDIRMDKIELDTERKTNKARYSAKEFTEEEFKKSDAEFNKKIKSLSSKIEILTKLSK